jgi:radical SAM-linked protein
VIGSSRASGRFGSPVAIQRARVRFSREGAAAQLSHLKQIETIRRAIEASSWPAARTQAKKPKLKIAFGPAVSVGYESDAEYVDVELAARLDAAKAREELQKHLPPGFGVISVKSIPRFFPSLEETINAARVRLESPLLAGTKAKWESFWAAASFPVTKKKQDREEVIDARALVKAWSLEGDRLELVLRFGPGRTLKAERIAQAVCGLSDGQVEMGGPECQMRVRRLQLYLEKQDGELIEP